MKPNWTYASLMVGLLVSALVFAQEKLPVEGAGSRDKATKSDPDPATVAANDEGLHDQLRTLRTSLTEALKKGDVEGQLAHVHDNVVTTWQNHRVVRGHDGLRKFLEEINAENKEVFRGYKVEPQVDELTILYGGDTGIAFGTSVPQYHYLGMDFELENRWTATLVKDGGDWKIAAYHVSANVVDNPLLNVAKQSAYWAGGICLVLGMIMGSIATVIGRRRGRPQTTA
jgi:ketosteroid isomerase-like protein